MIILTIRTDKPEAEIGLYDGQKQVTYKTWTAHRALAESLHTQIGELFKKSGLDLGPDGQHPDGIACFKGPGSFTGLRIGLTVANALASAWQVPIAAHDGDKWLDDGIDALQAGKGEKFVVPEYGNAVITSSPKK